MLGGIRIWEALVAIGLVMIGASLHAVWRSIRRKRRAATAQAPSAETPTTSSDERAT